VRIAVTGATGFVGGAVARRLISAGRDVLAIGRSADGPDGIDYAQWDLSTDAPPPAELRSIGAVVHAAAHVAGWGDDRVFQAVTVAGTAKLLDVLDPAARLIVIGSSSVYAQDGRTELYLEADGPVEEHRYLGPYARAKADQERLIAARRPSAIVLRPRSVWGPGDKTLLPRVEARVRVGRLLLPDGARHSMSTTHIESLVDAVDAALEHEDIRGPVNVADATPHSPAELLEALFAAQGRSVRILGIPGGLAARAAVALEAAYRLARLRGEPPFTRYAIDALVAPVILDLTRLHDELKVKPDADLGSRASELAGPAQV
jgi:nucleoside-diphosphate-sugar epimerase